MILYMYMYIALRQGQTTSSKQNFDVNRNLLSPISHITNFKQIKSKLKALILSQSYIWLF